MTYNMTDGLPRLNHWCWGLERNKEFTVRSLRKELDARILVEALNSIWANLAPIKTNIFIWRFRLHSLPTMDTLTRRGVTIQDTKCVRCNVVEETEHHTFVECRTTKELLALTANWVASIILSAINSVDELLVHQLHPCRSKAKEAL
ncbi:hypothetical protein LXL04_002372 [Taraxacum kok-saghyz]